MSSYLLPCPCGNTTPVDIGQAGGRVTCSCGAQLDVPPLRQLRHLPREIVLQGKKTAGNWGARQGIVAASLIIATVFLAWGSWIWWSEPVVPKFDPAARLQAVENQIKTPAGAWEAWIDYYRPMAENGIPVFRIGNAAFVETRIAHARFLRWMLWAVAGVMAIVAISGALWPQSGRRSQPRG
jgi:hypothetical protein